MQNNKDFSNKKPLRKPGRTLVIKTDQDVQTSNMVGLTSHAKSSNGSQFFVFDTVNNAKTAFKSLKEANFRVRFAHYRIFFTMTGIDDSVNYNDLKEQHVKWINQNSGADVIYYKQYRKENKFLGCGDFTIDTKECMDKLLEKDGLKNYSFGKFSGTFYRYNKKDGQEQQENA
jgi:hypothetical protein